jgi:hypothetical protein
MDDVDPAIATMDSMAQYTPGVDMIAQHKQAMKKVEPPKPKSFNSADYLLPTKKVQEPSTEDPVASGSRFQRFFTPNTAPPPPPPPVPAHDDRAARLMGMLSLVRPFRVLLMVSPLRHNTTCTCRLRPCNTCTCPRLSITTMANQICSMCYSTATCHRGLHLSRTTTPANRTY